MSYPSYAYPTPSYDDIPNFAPNYYGSNMQPYYNQQVYTGFEGTDATKWIEDNKYYLLGGGLAAAGLIGLYLANR